MKTCSLENKPSKLVYLLLTLVLLFGYNNNLDYIVHIVIIFILLFTPFMEGTIAYIFLSVWIQVMYQGQHQLFIYIIEVLILIKGVNFISTASKVKIKLHYLIFLMVFFSYVATSFLFYRDYSALRLLFPFVIMMIYRLYITQCKKDIWVGKAYLSFVASVFAGIVHGLIQDNFMVVRYGNSYSRRFNGIHSPNYMAFYINISIAICLFTDIFPQKVRIVLVSFLYIALLLTMSTTGALIGFGLLFLFSIINISNMKNWNRKRMIIGIIIFSVLLLLTLQTEGLDYSQIPGFSRVTERNELSLDSITNNRFTIWLHYWREFLTLNMGNNLFGTALFSLSKPNPFLGTLPFGPHNTYLEVLWATGFIGVIAFLVYTVLATKEMRFSRYYLAIRIVKVVILVNMISTTLITDRLWYILLMI